MENMKKLVQEALNEGIVIQENEHLGFRCNICQTGTMTGIISVGQHLTNSKHTEAGVRIAINNPQNAPASLLRLLSPAVRAAAEEDVVQVVELPGGCPGLLCKVCDKQLTGLAPLQQHLQGSDHKKKLSRSQSACLQSSSINQNTWKQVPNGTTSSTNQQVPNIVSHAANSLIPARNDVVSNARNQIPYATTQVQSTWNQLPPEMMLNTRHQASHELAFSIQHQGSDTRNQVPCDMRSNPWLQAPNGRISNTWNQVSNLTATSSWNQVPNGQLSPKPLWTGSPRTPAIGPVETQVAQSATPNPPFPPPIMGARPRPIHTPLLTNAPTSHITSSMEYTQHNAAASLSPVAQQSNDDQVIQYNAVAKRNECLICQKAIPGDSMGIDYHLASNGHREEGAKYAIQNPTRVPECLLDLLPQGAIEAAIAGILFVNQSRVFQCRPCDKVFTGVLPLKEHMARFDHLKKYGNLSHEQQASGLHFQPSDDAVMDELTKAFEDGIVICTDSSSDQVTCTVCNTKVNGRKNLEDHLNGRKHEKKQKEWEKRNQNAVHKNGGTNSTKDNVRRSLDSPESEPSASWAASNLTENSESQALHPVLIPYSVESTPRGQVHIFNYLFEGRTENPKERKGAKRDTVNLMFTFNRMGYHVFPHEELTTDETYKILDDIRQDKALSQVDVLVMFFLSHGTQPFKFFAFDGQELDLRDIWDKFTDSACPFMKKKPKIFFANFCRGNDDEMPETDAKIDIPRDMVTIHASSERITALRSPKHGTHFVRALCEILENNAKTLELREIYHMLDVEVKVLGGRQPKWEDSRFRKFYFSPAY